jgi:GT2 family glycosyltransferase
MSLDVLILSNDQVLFSGAAENVKEYFGVTPKVINDATSIATGYNRLAKQSNADIFCFMHHDARVKFKAEIIEEYFRTLPNPGILGFCGTDKQIPGKQWWECPTTYGGLMQGKPGEDRPLDFAPVTQSTAEGKLGYQPVQTMDGYCLFVKREVFEKLGGFDENYEGWHGYDIDICAKALAAGYQNYVISHPSVHFSMGASGPALDSALNRFKEKWSMLLSKMNTPSQEPKPVRKDKLKIVVYTICRDELQFVERFMKSCEDADGVYVLDTGSKDGTPEALAKLGATVKVQPFTKWKTLEEYDKLVAEEKNPWRFDIARNMSIDMCPADADVLVCIDLDEILVPGWRKIIEDAWAPGINHLSYLFAWSMEGGKPKHCFWYEKIHSRNEYVWASPVHEAIVLKHGCVDKRAAVQTCLVQHYPDASKSRAQYLPLLELCVREAPNDPRVRFYLGREYTFVGRYQDAIDSHKHLLAMPNSNCARERANACSQIAGSYGALKDTRQQFHWLLKAITEVDWQRESWVELADFCRLTGDNMLGYWAAKKALAIPHANCDNNYLVNPEDWKQRPHDIASITGWWGFKSDQREDAVQEAWTALTYSPWDTRMENNYRLMQNCLEKPNTAKQIDVDVIMLAFSKTFREYQMAKEAIQSLRSSSPDVGMRILVVETNANLPFENFTRQDKDNLFGKGVEVCYPDSEFGFNKFLKAGYDYLQQRPSQATHVVIMNNDVTLFNPGFMKYMLIGLQSISSASPLGLREATWGLVNRSVPIDMNYDINRSVNGWFLMFDKKILNALKFEELFPLQFTWYGGDMHYAQVLEKCGYKHGLVNAAQALHLQMQSHALREGGHNAPANREEMLKMLDLKDKHCVEVGVEMGVYSQKIWEQKPATLLLIDPWVHQDNAIYPHTDTSNVQNDVAEQRYQAVAKMFEGESRVVVMRDFSTPVAQRHPDNTCDFVYIDAIHTKEACFEDMCSWWPKVKSGGWLCGHDYQFQPVVDAVKAFCEKEQVKLAFITKEGAPSWAIKKP